MAHPCGTKDKPLIGFSQAASLVRFVGFYGLASAALAILAAVTLLPLYAQYLRTEHHRDCLALRIKEAQATRDALTRLKNDLKTDPVLVERMSSSKLGVFPKYDIMVLDSEYRRNAPPGSLSPIHYNDPPLPKPWVQTAARKVSQPSYRRGLLVLAACLTIAAMLLFAPPSTKTKNDDEEECDDSNEESEPLKQ